MDPLSVAGASTSAPVTAPLPPKPKLATVTGPGLVRPRPAAPRGRSTGRDAEEIDVQALARQLGISPADLRAAIARTQSESGEDPALGGRQGGRESALPWAPPAEERQQSAARTARTLGVAAQGLHEAILSAAALPKGANPLQHAARLLNVDPNVLMTAMHENGLSFVDEYA